MLNKAMIIGRLGDDPKMKEVSASKVTNFSVATGEKWKDKEGEWQERTEWHKITVWGNQAASCAQYLKKGSQVYVEGRIETRSWEDKEGAKRYSTSIVATQVRFLDSKPKTQDLEPTFDETEQMPF